MVGRHHVVAHALAELVGEPLGEPAGVDEHQRGAMVDDQRRDPIEDVAHLLGRGHRLELALGKLQCQVEVAEVPDVDHRR